MRNISFVSPRPKNGKVRRRKSAVRYLTESSFMSRSVLSPGTITGHLHFWPQTFLLFTRVRNTKRLKETEVKISTLNMPSQLIIRPVQMHFLRKKTKGKHWGSFTLLFGRLKRLLDPTIETCSSSYIDHQVTYCVNIRLRMRTIRTWPCVSRQRV